VPDPRGVDEGVDAPESPGGLVDRRLGRSGVDHVALDGDCVVAGLLAYGLAARQDFGPNRLPEPERRAVRAVLTIPATALVAAVFWIGLPAPYFRLAWLVFALVLFEVGANSPWAELKVEAAGDPDIAAPRLPSSTRPAPPRRTGPHA
jgi:hypothetical protein